MPGLFPMFRSTSHTNNNIPFWPQPFCVRNNPETTCDWLFGLVTVSCREPITYNTDFTSGTEGAHVWTFIVVFLLGMSALSYVPSPWEWKDSMKITCALYSAETAFFALIRLYLGLSKPLLVGAAIHNLFEWSIILHLMNETKNFTHFLRNMQLASIWIITVISVAIMIPNLLLAFTVEQTTGIMLDFSMPLMFLAQLLSRTNDKEVKQFYTIPAIAHTVHLLFTIIPLVMANFFVGTLSWYSSFVNEIFVYISVPVTHLLYIFWSHQVDTLRQNHALCVGETKDDCLLPVQYRFKGAPKYIGVGFIMGLFMLFGVPILIGECTMEMPTVCIPTGPITGTSVALVKRGYEEMFIDLVETAKLVESGRKFKGNVNYKMVQNVFNQREFRFIETWDSYAAVNAWRNSSVPKTLFSGAGMKVTLAGGALTNFGAYANINSNCAVPKQPKTKIVTSTTATKK